MAKMCHPILEEASQNLKYLAESEVQVNMKGPTEKTKC